MGTTVLLAKSDSVHKMVVKHRGFTLAWCIFFGTGTGDGYQARVKPRYFTTILYTVSEFASTLPEMRVRSLAVD